MATQHATHTLTGSTWARLSPFAGRLGQFTERRFFAQVIGTDEPPGERPGVSDYVEKYIWLTKHRPSQLAAGTAARWLAEVPFFGGLVRERIWVFWRCVLNTGHRTRVRSRLRPPCARPARLAAGDGELLEARGEAAGRLLAGPVAVETARLEERIGRTRRSNVPGSVPVAGGGADHGEGGEEKRCACGWLSKPAGYRLGSSPLNLGRRRVGFIAEEVSVRVFRRTFEGSAGMAPFRPSSKSYFASSFVDPSMLCSFNRTLFLTRPVKALVVRSWAALVGVFCPTERSFHSDRPVKGA